MILPPKLATLIRNIGLRSYTGKFLSALEEYVFHFRVMPTVEGIHLSGKQMLSLIRKIGTLSGGAILSF